MTARGSRVVVIVATLGLLAMGEPAARDRHAAAAPDLTGVDALVRVYDFILDARFDQADAELPRACATAPREACDVLASTATWWRILLDPDSRALDRQFAAEAEDADHKSPNRSGKADFFKKRQGVVDISRSFRESING